MVDSFNSLKRSEYYGEEHNGNALEDEIRQVWYPGVTGINGVF